MTESVLTRIRSELAMNNVCAAGDGSAKRGKAAQAWCIFQKDTKEIIFKSSAPVFGDPDHITSLRPETISSIAAGTFLNMIESTIPNLDTFSRPEQIERRRTYYKARSNLLQPT